MHTFKYKDWIIDYNPDMSGDVYIRHPTELPDRTGKKEVFLPAELIEVFAAELIRERRIAAIEKQSIEELILGLT